MAAFRRVTALEERHRQLRTTGSVELRQTWGNVVIMVFAIFALCAAGAFFIAGAIGPGEPWQSAFGHLDGWVGLAVILAVGTLGLVAIPWHVRNRGTLVVTWEGIDEYRRRGGRKERSMSIPWTDIESVTGRRIGTSPGNRQYVVQLRLTPDRWESYREELTPVLRHMAATGHRFVPPRTITLQRFEGGGKALRELLDRAHREFGSRSRRE